jgi:RluA family pseudouridine synthase
MALPPIIYEDDVLLAFDKPSGRLVAPERRDRRGENLMALVHAKFGPGIANVHRLDAETSGVLLCAKTKPALDSLSGQFQAKAADRIFHALTAGVAVQDTFMVELALAEDESRPGLMRVVKKSGLPSATRFQVLERFKGFTWIECRPMTGRTHQIRLHLAASGLPILNDDFYGNGAELLLSALKRRYKGRANERPLISRLALHAGELTITHPVTHDRLTLRAPLPNEFAVALKYLRSFAAG